MQKQDLFALPYQLLSVFAASVGGSQMVREELFLLAQPAQSAMQSILSRPYWHATPLFACSCCAIPSLLCHAPDGHQDILGCSHSLEALKSPHVTLSTALSLPGWLLWTYEL